MTLKRIVLAMVACSAAAMVGLLGIKLGSTQVHADDENDCEATQVAIGLRIAPPFLKTEGKDLKLLGLGSFIVNAQADCNGCHGSDPANEYLPTHNPYFLKPLNSSATYNQATYLNGGQNFGPTGPGVVQDSNSPLFGGAGLGPNIISRNLTPDKSGNPEGGNDLHRFLEIMKSGHDFDTLHLNCGTMVGGSAVTDNCYNAPVDGSLLQVMPWPLYRHMTDHQLEGIWTYLSAVPCNAHNDALGDQFPWLKNVCP